MKYLVVLIVVVLGVGLWRSRHPPHTGQERGQPRPPAPPQDMVACARCGVHVPRSEALAQGQQLYCCAAHLPKPAHQVRG